LAGLSKTHPVVAAALTIFMFSMAGIPPLAGFFSKLYIFLSAIESNFYGLALVAVLSSVVSAFYYLRIIKVIYFDDQAEPLEKPISTVLGSVIAGCSIVIILFFALTNVVIDSASYAAFALLEK
jgi:NADH-quinone oxidoreductase subunit N